MSKNAENYKRSLYLSTKILSGRQECTVEKVVNSFDGAVYVRRTYKEDKSEIFRILSAVKSPYLPEIVEIFGDDGETVIIEKYIEGETLAALIADKKITKNIAKSCARQLLSALSAIQEKEIVHRDIKPENIMISDGKLTLIDFGIARIYKENETRDTKHLGTEGYAAPEQYGFSQSDKRTDIYSAGKTILKICEAAKLGGRTKKTALKCSQFDPQNRFETARDALKYLKNSKKRLYAAALICLVIIAVTLLLVHYRAKSTQTADTPKTPSETLQKTDEAKQTQPQTTKTQKTEKNDDEKKGNENKITASNHQAKAEIHKPETKQMLKTEKLSETEESDDNAEYEDTAETGAKQLFKGPGKSMWVAYKNTTENASNTFAAIIDFGNGDSRKVSVQISERKLRLNIGENSLLIPFGNYIKLYNSDTAVIDAGIKYYDLDGDGVKEIFAAVYSRHGFCVEQAALWFAKLTGGKFILCGKPLNYHSPVLITLLPKDHAIVVETELYCINGTKFEKVK